ncbi:MAG: MazG-like family protein [Bacillota bacterium]|nr:MazG-like family protein [Bacillota bacterium]
MKNKEIDIATNLKVVDWLKAELVDSVAVLFKSLLKASADVTADALSTIIITTYLLGRRVGIQFQTIDMVVNYKLNNSINEANEIEQWYGDLTELRQYIESREQKKR